MKNFREIINNNSGKVRIAAIVLGIIIALALAGWTIILFGHFGQGNTPSLMLIDPEADAPDDGENSADITGSPDGDNDAHSIPATPEPEETPEIPSELEEIQISEAYPDIFRELGTITAQYDIVSAALAVYDGDIGQSFTYSYGYADIETGRKADDGTKFYIASLSKPVTAICVMTLVDGNFIDLDSDISNYFGYQITNPHFPDTPVTARMLLQHTSSLFDSGAFQESQENGSSESVKDLLEDGAAFRRNRPGIRFEYSDFGYAVLGALCERVSGKSLDTMAREVIFEPLNIDAAFVPANLQDTENIAVIYDETHEVSRSVQTQLEVEESETLGHDLHLAHGNLTISAANYAKIMAVLGGGGAYGETRILSEASAEEMHKTDVDGSGFLQGLATRYSDDEFIESEGFYWQEGSSYGVFSQSIYSISPNRGVVVITTGATTNRLENGMTDVCTELSRSAWKVFDTEEVEEIE